jgi:hypothetical protein
MLRIIAAVLAVDLMATSVAIGQNKQAEWFLVVNESGRKVSVSMKSKGRGSPTTAWQDLLPVDDGYTGMIPLTGFQPFSIAIWEDEQTALVISDQKLCDFMIQCRKQPKSMWQPLSKTMRYRVYKRTDKNRDPVDTGTFGTLNVDVANQHVLLVFQGTQPAPVPKPPPGPPAVEAPRSKRHSFDLPQQEPAARNQPKSSPHRFDP